ncbi:uncharacterized protein LOC110447639 [Mizuhopecten yessoensis]|uniref:CUB domain-containing protein n=1 Tax=Mizuhopecten yessoensis TaxID=6573 RepID=A0A210QUV3_MIZYE|nr:uncharacterized protein LOC110447639 [Mizuhopecten yessoensis]OWF52528.1 hypothetical protein KP79_PYT11402 [Mizuhopecten yessoensis]
MRRTSLRLGVIVLVVLPIYKAAQKDEDRYTQIFSEPCTNRFHQTYREEKPFLIDLQPGDDGFQHSKLCSMAFTASPVQDENGDNVLVCFKFLQFTLLNCSIELKVQGIEQKIHYFKHKLLATNEQKCFWRTTVYVHIRSLDYFNCDPTTRIRIEVKARNAKSIDDRIMSAGNWITATLLIVVFSIGALSLGCYKYKYKVRINRPVLGRTDIPDDDYRNIASRHSRFSQDQRSRPLPRLHNNQRMSAANGGFRVNGSRRMNGNRNQRVMSVQRRYTGQAQSPISGRERAERSSPHHDNQMPLVYTRAPPPSYEECMAATDQPLVYIQRHIVVDETDLDDIQEEQLINDSPPPYPGL